jgi:ketosteroid isomerase-like protein
VSAAEAIAQRLFDAINNGTLDELPEVAAPDWSTQRSYLHAARGSRRGRGRHPCAPAWFPRPPLDHLGARR